MSRGSVVSAIVTMRENNEGMMVMKSIIAHFTLFYFMSDFCTLYIWVTFL